MTASFRLEHDFLGTKEIPNYKNYGVQTLRARENFEITSITICKESLLINNFAIAREALKTGKKCSPIACGGKVSYNVEEIRRSFLL